MRYFLTLLLSFFIVNSFGQTPIDTLKTDEGTMIIYSNRTWEYVEDREFNGVMNEYLHKQIARDTNRHFIQTWDTDMCYTSDLKNDVNKIKDTIYMCVQDENSDKFVMPFDGVVTSRYGWRRGRPHNGIDIDLVTGDTVKSAWSGRVRYAKYNTGGFGNLVVIRHDNGLETFYAHLSQLNVVPNQIVSAGDPIGLGGNTGHSFGSHLHFEVRFYDIPIDPEKIIDFKTKDIIDENLVVTRSLFKGGSSSTYTYSSDGAKYYKVRSGDTLGAIARRNKTTVSKLCRLNGIRPTTILQIGKRLRIR